jgi:hypothetical protein
MRFSPLEGNILKTSEVSPDRDMISGFCFFFYTCRTVLSEVPELASGDGRRSTQYLNPKSSGECFRGPNRELT